MFFPADILQPNSASMDSSSYRKNTNSNQLRYVKWFDIGLKNVKKQTFCKQKKNNNNNNNKKKTLKDVLA